MDTGSVVVILGAVVLALGVSLMLRGQRGAERETGAEEQPGSEEGVEDR